MQFAVNQNKQRVVAQKGIEATCPTCHSRMIAKCGDVTIHHWAHESRLECDSWWETEGEWHRAWKEKFRPEEREYCFGPHRADVFRNGLVLEFQKSQISITEAIAREDFYKHMIWIFYQRWKTTRVFSDLNKTVVYGPNLTRLLTCLVAPVFIDIPNHGLFRVVKIVKHSCHGYFVKNFFAEIERVTKSAQKTY